MTADMRGAAPTARGGWLRPLGFLLLTSVLFGWLSFTAFAHWPARLELRLRLPEPVPARAVVQTPRGETTRFLFLANPRPLPFARREITIRNPASADEASKSQAALFRVRLDDVDVPPRRFRTSDEKGLAPRGDSVWIRPGEELRLRAAFHRAHVSFLQLARAGHLEIRLDGVPYARFDARSTHASDQIALPIAAHDSREHTYGVELPVTRVDDVTLRLAHVPPGLEVLSARLVVARGQPDRRESESIPIRPVLDADAATIRFESLPPGFNQRDHRVLVLARLCLAALLAGGAFGVVAIGRRWVRGPVSRRALAGWCVVTAGILGFGALAMWPAIMQTDSMSVWYQVKHLDYDTWFSHFYVFFVTCLSLLYDSPGVMTLLQTGAMFLLLVGSAWYFRLRGVPLWAVWASLLASLVSFPVLFYPGFFVRDVLYSILSVGLFVVLHALMTRARLSGDVKLSAWQLGGFGLAAAALPLLRAEGIYLLLAVPLVLYLFVARRLRNLALPLVVAGAAFMLAGTPLKRFMDARETPDYALTLLIEPLGQIINGRYLTDDPEADRRIIERVIEMEDLAARHYRLRAFWDDGYLKRGQYTAADVEALVRLTRRLALRNPDKFLSNRARMIAEALQANTDDVDIVSPLFGESVRQMGWDWVEDEKYRLAAFASAPSQPWHIALQERAERLRQFSLSEGWSYFASPRNLFWNAWLPALLVLVLLSQWTYFPATAVVCGLIGMRMAMLFLFAPMSHFKYFADLCFIFFLLPLLAWVDRRVAASRALRDEDGGRGPRGEGIAFLHSRQSSG